jgi:hypothetical protein
MFFCFREGSYMLKKSLVTILSLLVLTSSLFVWGCSNDDGNGPQVLDNTALKLRPLGLPSVLEENNLIYELWVTDTTDAATLTSLGQFFWNKESYEFINTLGFPRSDVFNLPGGKTTDDYNMMYITIEPYPDTSKAMSQNNLLRGRIIPSYPILKIKVDESLSQIAGTYALTSMTDFNLSTDDSSSHEISGIWFINYETTPFTYSNLEVGLDLPSIPASKNYTYEGWVYMEGWQQPLSLGKFRNPNYRDMNNPYVDDKYAPLVPGEDFLNNQEAPSWIRDMFPLELVGNPDDSVSMVYITLEPYPDPNPQEPFPLILMSRNLPLLRDLNDLKIRRAHQVMVLGNRYLYLPVIEVTRTAAVD